MPLMARGRGDVPRAWVAALEQVLEALDPDRRVTDFVLTGRHAEALTSLAGSHPWVQRAARHNRDDAMAALYGGFGEVDATVLRRWGRVLDASWPNTAWGLRLGDVGGCHWPELMLQQAAASIPSGQLPLTFADLGLPGAA